MDSESVLGEFRASDASESKETAQRNLKVEMASSALCRLTLREWRSLRPLSDQVDYRVPQSGIGMICSVTRVLVAGVRRLML